MNCGLGLFFFSSSSFEKETENRLVSTASGMKEIKEAVEENHISSLPTVNCLIFA